MLSNGHNDGLLFIYLKRSTDKNNKQLFFIIKIYKAVSQQDDKTKNKNQLLHQMNTEKDLKRKFAKGSGQGPPRNSEAHQH